MVAVLQGFGLIAVVVAVGWLLAHTGLFGEAEQRMLAKLTFWVGSPALLFLVISRADVGVVFSGFLVATIAGVVVASAAYMLLARLVWRRSTTDVLMGGMTVAYVNSNNLGVPIAAYVLGDASLAAPMLLFQLLLLQPAWLAALDLAGGGGAGADRRRMLLRPLTNPLTIGSLLGVLVALTGPRLPGAVIDPIELIAGLAIPGMLLAFGISLRLSPRPGSGGTGPELAAVVLAKLALMPLVTALTALYLLDLDRATVLAATVIAALPTAQNVFILAVTYGRAVRLARDGVFVTTLLAFPAMLLTVWLLG
ncbi:AEC family transporter [soil metagenome]